MSERQLGRHLLVDIGGAEAALLDDAGFVRATLIEAARAAGATIVASTFHKFAPIGVSGVVVIAESHLAIHTWPEHGFAAVDLFTCGASLDAEAALELIRRRFGAAWLEQRDIARGARLFPAGLGKPAQAEERVSPAQVVPADH